MPGSLFLLRGTSPSLDLGVCPESFCNLLCRVQLISLGSLSFLFFFFQENGGGGMDLRERKLWGDGGLGGMEVGKQTVEM